AASGAPWGFAAIPASDPARLDREDRLAVATSSIATRLLDRYAISRAIVPASVAASDAASASLSLLARRGDEALVAYAPGRPPAFWTTRWRREEDDDVLAAIAAPPGRSAAPLALVYLAAHDGGAEVDPGVEAAAGADTGAIDASPLHPCALARPRPGRVTLACDVTAAGVAVVLDAWAPGWSATVDGHPAAVERADLVARAVPVPAGAHTIDLRYRTPGLGLGALVSALALLNLALAAWLTRRARG
ncbi:MAG TPA: YfhO family protein, partial [Kofleriaceae bacterium]|nr:YfhO family protein [Kofleriaceae bacterium]